MVIEFEFTNTRHCIVLDMLDWKATVLKLGLNNVCNTTE